MYCVLAVNFMVNTKMCNCVLCISCDLHGQYQYVYCVLAVTFMVSTKMCHCVLCVSCDLHGQSKAV